MLPTSWLVGLVVGATLSAAAPSPAAFERDLEERADPTVTVNGGTFVGFNGWKVEKFFGIPYAQPPNGNRRFRPPVGVTSYSGTIDVSAYGNHCPQHGGSSTPENDNIDGDGVDALKTVFGDLEPTEDDNEDCLSLNIVRPKPKYLPDSGAPLPVLVWIYGGGFTGGKTKKYAGQPIVRRSISNDAPVIFVSMNYRVSAFGFLASKEVRAAKAGNLGLQDQREALRWIQKHIGAFGGDPTKVTIWGESAGAISVALQMAAYDGNHEGLFRGAFMQSGAHVPTGGVEGGQKHYDAIVKDTGCSGAADTLQCLRTVSYVKLKAAIDKTPGLFSYNALNIAWLPREDGTFLTAPPGELVRDGKVARVPYVTGNCDDEGTVFSLMSLNVTTAALFKTYLSQTLLPQLPASAIDGIISRYPQTAAAGSPFGTGALNALTSQFKRLAALQGDAVFQGPRRWFLENTASKQNAWAFLSTNFKALPVLGAFHASDMVNSFYLDGPMSDHVLNFANTLNPANEGQTWPKWTTSDRRMFLYKAGADTITSDTYRSTEIAYLNEILLENPV